MNRLGLGKNNEVTNIPMSMPSLDNTVVDPADVNVVNNQIKDATLGQEDVFGDQYVPGQLRNEKMQQHLQLEKLRELQKYENVNYNDWDNSHITRERLGYGPVGTSAGGGYLPGDKGVELERELMNMENIFDDEGNVIPEDLGPLERFNRSVFKKKQLGNEIPNINY